MIMGMTTEEARQEAAFHKFWTNRIKKELNATYVGWEQTSKEYSLKINLIDVNKKKRTLLLPISGDPSDTTKEHYLDLITKFHAKI